ncbi:hypothetical protein KEM52_005211 [Ascosphaera acerosa]|nr:hypothetical protein KEM52_005211 [Ascosphaera acerosa]
MVMLLSPTGNCFRHPYEQTRSLRQLVTNAKKLQQALEELTSRCPGLATASDLQHFASRLLAEVEGGIGLDHRTPYQPVSGWFQSDVQYLDWLADSERKIEQGLKYVKDTHDCARLIQRSTLSRAIPHTTNRLLGLRKSTEEVDGPTFVLQALNRVRERLEMLNNSHTTPTPRCFVSLFIRDHLKDAQLDDHVLIANASSCFAQQQADGIEDAKQFFAVYGDCADLPAARKYSDAFLHLYGLTPTEARGSLRDGPVTDVINERANYIYRNGQDGSSVKEEFRRFLADPHPIIAWEMKIKDKDKQAVKSRAAAEVRRGRAVRERLNRYSQIQSPKHAVLVLICRRCNLSARAALRVSSSTIRQSTEHPLNDQDLTELQMATLIEREQLRGPDAEHIVLLRPSMSYMVLRTTDTSSLHDVLPSFKNTTHIFVVVNDNENVDEASGGAHWSLLVVNVADKRAYHYDSYNCANEHEAQALTKKVGRLLFRDLKFVRVGSCPQQANESDCGVYVCMLMELLVQRLIGRDASHLVSMELANVSLDAGLARQQMLGRIEEVATPLALS